MAEHLLFQHRADAELVSDFATVRLAPRYFATDMREIALRSRTRAQGNQDTVGEVGVVGMTGRVTKRQHR